TELCRFSGQKIYPGRGIRFIRSDSQVFLFANSKCKRYFHKSQPAEAFQAYLDRRVQEAAQEGHCCIGCEEEEKDKQEALLEVHCRSFLGVRSRRGLRKPRTRRRRRRPKFPSHSRGKVRVVCLGLLRQREGPSLAVAVESDGSD
ncbi:60S ribosomal protein L24-2, partial [Linum grandiflorum]